jgi:phage terminase large subunit-like protein
MKTLKNIALSFVMAISVAGISTVAVASENTDAADVVIAKINDAKAAISAGKANTDVSTLIAEAKSKSKAIRANDKLAGKVQRAAQHLSKAIGALKESDPKLATNHLDEGAKAFADLKPEL